MTSYGRDSLDLFRRSAAYVDHILKGEKLGNSPVQQPTKFELVINLKTVRALGINVSATLLARTDELVRGIPEACAVGAVPSGLAGDAQAPNEGR